MTDPTTLSLDLGERSYDILVGAGLITNAARHISLLLHQPRVIIITDDNVGPIWLKPLTDSLEGGNILHQTIVLPAGEQTKNFQQLEQLVNEILGLGIERKTTLIALGGGVIGDITGFAASIILRGIDFIQIPTSLLAQVDSSVGGKTGINTTHGKNLAGAFYQPRLVLADTDALATLPKRQLLAGYAEVVKYGLIDDPEFFTWCDNNATALLDGDVSALSYAVHKSCQAKARIVSADERESGQRALLNLGHTFGHALEAEVGYGDKLLHGEAVGIGMIMAFELSNRLGLCDQGDVGQICEHFERVGLKTTLDGLADSAWNAEKLIGHMGKDKKVEAGSIAFVLARGIGKSFVSRDVGMEDVTAVLERALDRF
jgi:3-dehydroquinate synthase